MPFCPYCDFQIPLADAKFCPNCGKTIVPETPAKLVTSALRPTIGNPPPGPQGLAGEHWSLLPGEQIEWEKDFKEGIIHRHVDRAYVITNHRVVAVNTITRTVAASLPLKQTDLVVMDRRSSSTSTGVGSYHGGAGTTVRSGTSRTIGTLVFLENGIEKIRLGGIGDPDGVKNLFVSLKRIA
jgi:hypothetical protein